MSKDEQRTGKPPENYLKIPYHILNMRGIALCSKILYAYIYSFGTRGCWQSNKQIGEVFMVSERTIVRWLAPIRHLLSIRAGKGYYRTMWAKTHPEVHKAAVEYSRQNPSAQPGQNYPSAKPNLSNHLDKSAQVTTTEMSQSLRQNCPTTINPTIKETILLTTAPPTPLPARGQASAVLKDRQAGQQAEIESFKRGFGKPRPVYKPPPPEKFEENRRRVLAGLGVSEQTAKKI